MRCAPVTGLCGVVRESISIKVTLEKDLQAWRLQTRQRHLGEEHATCKERQEQMS